MLGTTPVGGDVSVPPPFPLAPRYDAVAALVDPGHGWGNVHDRASREQLLGRIAAYLDTPRHDDHPWHGAPAGALLLVPGDALDRSAFDWPVDEAAILGGVVPHAFVATKAITHPLIDADAARPAGWSQAMADRLGDAALVGFTAFTRADAARAGRRLLAAGPVRLKDVCGKAGLGQQVVADAAALDAALDQEDWPALAACGLVLEANLTDVVTYSVGSVRLGDERISYWGSQSLTTDHHGREVYGGSDLYAVRGDLDALAALDLPVALARAVQCARAFDAAAHQAYPDIRLTRRNYDVIEGTGHDGLRRIGVLEQSWRVGGASGAEIAAFEALRAEPDTPAVRCSTVEVYAIVPPPVGAILYYQGDDPVVGAMTKYAVRLA